LKENEESDGIFGNISFVEIEIPKINYLFDKHVLKWPRDYGTQEYTSKNLIVASGPISMAMSICTLQEQHELS